MSDLLKRLDLAMEEFPDITEHPHNLLSDSFNEIVRLNDESAALRQQLSQAQADVARLREALWHAMQCWEYDGVSDEHGAVAAECSARLGDTEGPIDAFIKIKQAEALKAVNLKIAIMCEEDPQEVIEAEAQRLRGEVDDA